MSPESANDRRRNERRVNARLADLSLPEFRRILVTTLLFTVVIVLFVWMVRTVIIAAIVGAIIAVYVRPAYDWTRRRIVAHDGAAAALTLVVLIVPVLALVTYSFLEIREVAEYVGTHQEEIAAEIDAALRRLPFNQGADFLEGVRGLLLRVSDYGAQLPEVVSETIAPFALSSTVFLFTAFYVLVDGADAGRYLRATIPARYEELVRTFEANVRGVLYGAVYATLVTQTVKSLVVFALNIAFDVPLAAVLAILAFVIGFFPIVGSWSVYVPVAAWLLIFRDAPGAAAAMVTVGFVFNTLIISTYVRPKLAAEKSRVLNFYWMFVGLVTGVYTFGIAGILLGPILIGSLKAIIDTVTAGASWRLLELHGGSDDLPAPPAGANA